MGFAHYGGRSVPIFIIDNKRAFCMQQEKHTPDHNGYTNSGVANPFDNNLARTVLYYGESGQDSAKVLLLVWDRKKPLFELHLR